MDISIKDKQGALRKCDDIAQINQTLADLNNNNLKKLINELDENWDSGTDEKKALDDLRQQMIALGQLCQGVVQAITGLRNYITSLETIEDKELNL